jgi:hypothetical protein
VNEATSSNALKIVGVVFVGLFVDIKFFFERQ